MTGNLTLPGGGGDTDALQKQEIEELIEIEIDAIDTSDVSSGPTFPPTAEENELFFNTTDGRLYIYYNDGSSSQWVDASPDNITDLSGYVEKSGDTMTGALNVPAGASGTEVPQVQEVVQKSGDTMTGNLNVPSLFSTGPVTAPNTVKSWCNFNGLFAASGYQGRAGYNIKEITKLGTGSYQVTFDSPMDGDDYAVTLTASGHNASGDSGEPLIGLVRNKTANGFQVITYDLSNSGAKPQQGVREANVDFAVWDF
jgi:hypothetical protein